METLIILLTE